MFIRKRYKNSYLTQSTKHLNEPNCLSKILMVFEKPKIFGYLGEEYLRAFFENGWHVTVCYLCGHVDPEYKTQLPVHEIIEFGLTKRQVRGLKIASIRKMTTLLRKESFNLVFSHQYQSNVSVGVAGCFTALPKSYAVLHGLRPTSAFPRKLFYSTIGKNFTRLIAVSQTQKKEILNGARSINPDRIAIVHNVINSDYIQDNLFDRYTARNKLSVNNNDFIIGTISRITEKKRSIDLVRGLNEIKDDIPHAKAVIIGEGRELEKILSESKVHGLEKRVVLPGFIPLAWRFMKAFDVFVFPSITDSNGLVLLEAMVSKVPIIAARANALIETLENNALYFDSCDYKDLADKIIRFYRLSEMEKNHISENGFKQVQTKFSRPLFQKRIFHLLNST